MKKLELLKSKVALLLSVLLVTILAPTAPTHANTVTEYPVLTPATLSCGMTKGSDGNMWFVKAAQRQMVKLGVDGQMTDYPIPRVDNSSTNVFTCSTSPGANGEVWFVSNENNPDTSEISSYVRNITPNGTITTTPINIPDTPGNAPHKVGLTHIRYIDDNNIWLIVGSTSESPQVLYSMILKVDRAGNILSQQEQTTEAPMFSSAIDSSGNLYFGKENSLTKVSSSGGVEYIELEDQAWIQVSEFLGWGLRSHLEADIFNNLWFYSVDPVGQNFLVTRYNTTSGAESYPLPAGTLALSQLLSDSRGTSWLITGNQENSKITNHTLSSVGSEGIIQEHRSLGLLAGDTISSSLIGPDGNLWAIVSNFGSPSSTKIIKIDLPYADVDVEDPPAITPTAPKSGNAAIIAIISSLSIGSLLLFYVFIYRKKKVE